MNRKLKKLLISVMTAFMIAVVGPFGQMISWASNTKISFSDPSVMVGNDVTVNMKVTSDTALGTAEVMLSYDPGILEFVSGTSANGGAGAIKILGTMDSADQKTFNFSLKFKTLQAGNAQIKVTSQEIYDVNSQALSLSKQGSATVKVTSPATVSKDATLKSLKISPGTLSPAFSAAVDQYTTEVDANTSDLVVNAVAANAGANVALEGDKGLKAGENKVVVKVTAEDGQTIKNYTITVKKPEGGESVRETNENGETKEAEFADTKVTVNGTEYDIATSFDEASLPEGFEAATFSYKGTDVMSGKGLEKDLLLLYLKDAGGNGGFFVYNEKSDSWSQFVQVETSSKAIVIIPLDTDTKVPEGFTERSVDIDGVRVTGWVAKTEAEPEYCVFYAMNWNGEKEFYRYDLKEKTIQRYFASGVSGDEYTKLAKTYACKSILFDPGKSTGFVLFRFQYRALQFHCKLNFYSGTCSDFVSVNEHPILLRLHMEVSKIHITIPVILIHIVISCLIMVSDTSFVYRLFRQGPFLLPDSLLSKKLVNRTGLYTGFKLPFRVSPAVKGLR